MSEKIGRLMEKIIQAEEALQAELRRQYPEGSIVHVYLGCDQGNPSESSVIGHPGGRFGRLRVRLTRSPKQMVRDVSYGNYHR